LPSARALKSFRKRCARPNSDVRTDATDDKFLELAVNGQADLIVSGDSDLLAPNPFRDIPIVTPAVFVQGAAR
jgi:predicted nucleic acid-binding protein